MLSYIVEKAIQGERRIETEQLPAGCWCNVELNMSRGCKVSETGYLITRY
jgi:hypothetical protein